MQAGYVELLDPIVLAETKGHVLKLKRERKVSGTHQRRTRSLSKIFSLPVTHKPQA